MIIFYLWCAVSFESLVTELPATMHDTNANGNSLKNDSTNYPVNETLREMKQTYFFAITCIFLLSAEAKSYQNGSFGIGIEYYSQNAIGRITKTDDASGSFLGAASYPLLINYEWNFTSDWFLSPELSYTPLSRQSAGDAAETTMIELIFPFGTEILKQNDFSWDWQFGPGIVNYKIKGQGGTEVLSNGTSTSTFARPGNSVTVQNYILDLGTNFNYSKSSIGLGVIFEGFFSSQKRTQSLLLSYMYHL